MIFGILNSCSGIKKDHATKEKFTPTSESLKHYTVPQWYKDAKFGIYFHWAPFSVPAYKTEWYPHYMYYPTDLETNTKGNDIHDHHIQNWGSLDKFGYKDFIPMFKAENLKFQYIQSRTAGFPFT